MSYALRILPITALIFLLAACGSGPQFSESVYQAREVGVAKRVVRCRVLAVRTIQIRDEEAEARSRATGALVGSLLGAVVGGQFGGDGNDQAVGAAVGATAGSFAGGAIGENVGESKNTRDGLEYSIITADGREMTFAQDILQGDRIVGVGETCRMQTSGRINRVLPAEYLPETIDRPKETTFN